MNKHVFKLRLFVNYVLFDSFFANIIVLLIYLYYNHINNKFYINTE